MENFSSVTMYHGTQPFSSITEHITTLSEHITNNSVNSPTAQQNHQVSKIVAILDITILPTLLIVGTIGNLLTFIVMQRGSLKHSSTCFYMLILAISDSCKYSSNSLLIF